MTTPFTALPSGIDLGTAELMTAIPFSSNEEVAYWFELLHQAYEAGPQDTDTTGFAARVRETAPFDPGAVEEFLQALEYAGEGVQPVARMLELQPQLPDLYWELYWQRYGEAEPDAAGAGTTEHGTTEHGSAEDRFGWVTEAQSGRLATAWGADWQHYLGEQLDYRWGQGWESNPAEHKQPWLDALLDELLAPAAEQTGPAEDEDDVDLDELVERMVAEAVAEIPGAEQLDGAELEEVAGIVRRNLQEELAR
jgi:hypothetical protein